MALIIDEKDTKIIEILKEHGDYTTREIAKKTLIPITTINNRIRKLKKNKVIKKFTIELDKEKVGKGFSAYVLISVNLKRIKELKKSQYDIAKELRCFEFVKSAEIVSGGWDIVALVEVADIKEFDKALLGKIQLIEGIEKTLSLIAIH